MAVGSFSQGLPECTTSVTPGARGQKGRPWWWAGWGPGLCVWASVGEEHVAEPPGRLVPGRGGRVRYGRAVPGGRVATSGAVQRSNVFWGGSPVWHDDGQERKENRDLPVRDRPARGLNRYYLEAVYLTSSQCRTQAASNFMD